MSWGPPSAGHSPAPEGLPEAGPDHEFGLAALVRMRGGELVGALDHHLPGAGEHAQATGSYAFAAAVELGHDRGHCELLREAAKLHEVGLVYVPAEALRKDAEALTAEERARLDGHFDAGYRLARGAGLPDQVCGWILRLRERFDGHGQEGLAADGIPIESRIVRAACACDRALSDPAFAGRGAAQSERRRKALDELRGKAGAELDPRVVDALVTILNRAA